MKRRPVKQVSYPEYQDSKYLIVDGAIYINTAAEPRAIITARFLQSGTIGGHERGR